MSAAKGDLTVRRARRSERDRAASLFAAAFEQDPLITAATGGTLDPAKARESVFRSVTAGTLLAGGRLVLAERSGMLLGAALIAGPHSGSARRALRSSLARVVSGVRFLLLGPALAPGALRLLNAADLASRRLGPRHPHHVLVAVGVDAAARKLGIGRRLVEHAVEHARHDPRSWGIRLETENPHNVERYGRWGFQTLGVVEVGAVHVWVMAQQTRPGRDR